MLAADSHPGPEALGRMVVFDGEGEARSVRIRPEDAAPSILARMGVPAARDLGGHPVASLLSRGLGRSGDRARPGGPRVAPPATSAPESDREYLEKLRSLGYLQ